MVLVVVEAIYTVTDPAMATAQKVVPPLRVGNVALDMSPLVLIIALQVVLLLLRFVPF